MPKSPKDAFGKFFLPFVAKLIALCDDPPREAVDKILVLKSKRRKLLILFFFWSCTSLSLFFVVSEPVFGLEGSSRSDASKTKRRQGAQKYKC